MAYVSEEFEVDGADVAAVLAWADATASPDRTYEPPRDWTLLVNSGRWEGLG
jgi:hypothetical protein